VMRTALIEEEHERAEAKGVVRAGRVEMTSQVPGCRLKTSSSWVGGSGRWQQLELGR
jgi:hypothetical protein